MPEPSKYRLKIVSPCTGCISKYGNGETINAGNVTAVAAVRSVLERLSECHRGSNCKKVIFEWNEVFTCCHRYRFEEPAHALRGRLCPSRYGMALGVSAEHQ